MRRCCREIVCCACLLAAARGADAASLKVAPARFIVHNVTPGTVYDIHAETGLRLTVYNDDEVSRTWLLSTHRPSERGTWETGYAEIPDAHWCWLDRNEVTVEPNGKAYAHLFLQVPAEERYYNQQWVVTLGIEGKRNAGGVALAADVRMQIETKSKEDVSARPDGPLGIRPSLLRFEDAAPGGEAAADVTVFNNSAAPGKYTVVPLFGQPGIEPRTYLTHGFEAIADKDWLVYESVVSVEPGGTASLRVVLKIPGDAAHYGKRWEELLLFRTEDGLSRFVRVQV
ncbi:MAG TPA: hypothetical protein PKL84_14435, partial [Candidatus Hydrogenedentes bacterium]|nr:hypothetical protein [Candidatus Hydrogenedentota bacterium]